MTDSAQREQADRIRADREFWRAIVAEVGRDRMLEPGPMGEWTFKDLAAHLAAWRNRRIGEIEALARGESKPPWPWATGGNDDDDDTEAINAAVYEHNRDRPLDDVLADYDATFERLAQAIEALPESVAHDPNALFEDGDPIVDLDFTEHLHEEHVPAIRAWLDRRTP